MSQSDEKSASDPMGQLVDRINQIEVKLEYLQRDYETQNDIILVDAKRIQILEDTVRRLAQTVDLLSSHSDLPGSPEDDKPPHY